MDKKRIKDAEELAKEIVNNAYKMNEFERKFDKFAANYFNGTHFYIYYYSYSIQINIYQPDLPAEGDEYDETNAIVQYSTMPFGKFKDLLIEEVEDHLPITYVKERFEQDYGHYSFEYKFLGLTINIDLHPGDNCKLEKVQATVTKYKMKCGD